MEGLSVEGAEAAFGVAEGDAVDDLGFFGDFEEGLDPFVDDGVEGSDRSSDSEASGGEEQVLDGWDDGLGVACSWSGGAEEDHDGGSADFVGESHGGLADWVLQAWMVSALHALVGALGPPGFVIQLGEGGLLLLASDDQKVPGLGVAAVGRLAGSVEDDLQVLVGDRVGAHAADGSQGVHGFVERETESTVAWHGRFLSYRMGELQVSTLS